MKWNPSVVVFVVVFFSSCLPSAFASPAPDGQFVLKCFGCHGRSGISGYWEFPNLAGQNHGYILKQLKAFRDGQREDLAIGAMPHMVKGMTDDDLYGLADIFASLPAEKVNRSEMSAEDVASFKRGKAIVERTETTCRFCHLSNATRDAPLSPEFPVLPGQQKGYLINQIKAFQTSKRWTPTMNADLVGSLSDQETTDIATYLRFMRVP